MRFVLDASVAIAWAMPDEGHPLADRALLQLQEGSAIAPAIWWYEIRNILLLSERHDRIAPEDSIQFLTALELMRIDVDFSKDSAAVMGTARKYRLSVYDAAYLALAIREHLPLATLDAALLTAALSAGLPQLG